MGKNASIRESPGPCSGPLPHHWFTESQTCAVLDMVAYSKAYFRLYILQPGKGYRDRYSSEKSICLQLLRDTKWMDWMIRHGLVVRDPKDVLHAQGEWGKNHSVISRLFQGLAHLAKAIRSKLGPVSSPAQLQVGTPAHKAWAQWQQSGIHTWYFKYVALQLRRDRSWLSQSTLPSNDHDANRSNDRVLSFDNPVGIESPDDDHEVSSSKILRRPSTVTRNKRKTHEDWPKRQVSERIPWAEYIATVNDEKDIPAHLHQIISPTTTTPSSSNLIEMSSVDSDSESVNLEERSLDKVIEDQFDHTMFLHTPQQDPPLDQSMIIAPVVDIARNIPLPSSPMLSATSLAGTEEDRSYVDLVKVLCRILKLEVDKKPSNCMDKTEIIISEQHYELYPYIPQLVTSLGGSIFIDSKSPKPLTCGVQRYAIDIDWSLDRNGSSKSNTLIGDGSPRLDFNGLLNLIRDLREKELSPGNDDIGSGDLLTF